MITDEIIRQYVNDIFSYAHDMNIVFPKKATLSIYHHEGVENIYECGATFINVVNKDYCKSYVIMLKGQKYPMHFHRIKEETYYILNGRLHLKVNDEDYILYPGERKDIERGEDHSFWGENGGVIFEELSTMYVPNDSIYKLNEIKEKTYDERRTIIQQEYYSEVCEKWK